MYQPKATQLIRKLWRLAAVLATVLAAAGVRAADTQPDRFLLIFETSPVLKKNLPAMRQTLGNLFIGNLQNEMRTSDDLAVWTVDKELHTSTYPLQSWAPDDAAMVADQLNDFLKKQKFTRHASLAPIQPLLNRIVTGSEHLTVLIFCDSSSRLQGTPYDSGVNEIITNAVTRARGAPSLFIIVLRAYHGEYLGCSVNRSLPLSFPEFPPPPKPAPPPEPKPAETPASPTVAIPATGPSVKPIPAMIIVGTNATTNAAAALKPAAPPAIHGSSNPPAASTNVAPPTVPVPQSAAANATNATNAVAQTVPAPAPTTNTLSLPPPATIPGPVPVPKATATAPPAVPAPTNPPAISTAPSIPSLTNPLPPPATVHQTNSTPTPSSVAATPPVTSTNGELTTAPSNSLTGITEDSPSDGGNNYTAVIVGSATLLVAAGIGVWMLVRDRRPRSSLITSSMQDDSRQPPGK